MGPKRRCEINIQCVTSQKRAELLLTSFLPTTKQRPSLRRVSRKSQMLDSTYTQTCCNEFRPHRSKNVNRKDTGAFTPRSKVWLSLNRFSWNSKRLSDITWRSVIKNFTQTSQEIRKVRAEIHLRHQVSKTVTDRQTDKGNHIRHVTP
jgi:hypothetical protein